MDEPLHSQLLGILEDEAACKRARTCSRLEIRHLFHEPNEHTLPTWQREHAFYREGIDRRVVFVCESPSDRRDRTEKPHFVVDGQPGWICWNLTWQDKRFREARVRYGFENCLITNAVKCGLVRPSTPAKLTDEEISACAGFLAREIATVRPAVVACMGGSPYRIVREKVLPRLNYPPAVLRLTHYSHRCSNQELRHRWDEEFDRLRTLAGRFSGGEAG